jgi:hypothetical protein
VTHLILTGGHSAWYFVIDALREVFPHLSVAERTVLRHPCPEQSVARGLAYVPLVRASKSGVMAPARRAAHAIWLSIPNGALAGAARNGGWDEPVLLLPRGQQLPFQTRKPLRICVEQLGLDAREATVSIRFFSGQRRMPLAERVATFDRGVWEQLGKRLSHIFPWMRGGNPDQFEVLVACKVDEHELITAELLVTRMLGGKPLEVQRQTMKLNSAAA